MSRRNKIYLSSILVIFLFWNVENSFGNWSELNNIHSYLESIDHPEQSLKVGLEINRCGGESNVHDPFDFVTNNELKQENMFNQNKFDTDTFCKDIESICEKWHGSKFCTDTIIEGMRYAEEKIRAKVTKYTEIRFSTFTNDDAFLSTCCKDNSGCKQSLKNINLKITPGKPEWDSNRWDASTKTVFLSLHTISGCRDEACIDEILLHELGHSCHTAIVDNSNHSEISTKEDSCAERRIPYWKTYAKYFGENVTECIKAGVLFNLETTDLDPCADHWTDEAFSSVIFSKYYTNKLHFQRICKASSADIGHPRMNDFIHCIPKRQNQ